MDQTLATLLPVFGLVGLGYAAGRAGLLPRVAVRALSRVLFDAAIPLMLCVQLAGASLSFAAAGPLLLAYYGGTACAFAAGLGLGRRAFGRPLEGAAVSALCAAFSNMVLLGLPLATAALGPQAAVPVSLLVALQSPLLLAAALALIQPRPGGTGLLRRTAEVVLDVVLRTPIVLGVVVGVAWNVSGLPVPAAAAGAAFEVGRGILPAAALLLGAALSAYGVQGNVREAMLVSLLKTSLHPLLVWALGRFVFGLAPLELAVATLMAAMPTGINAYLLAQRHETGVRLAATCVLLSTVPSLVASAVVLGCLGTR
jgi:malonate transporter and related proteins